MADGNQPRDFLLSEGEGWKLGFDRDPINSAAYTALVASDAWSVSMTKQEFTDFVQASLAHFTNLALKPASYNTL